MSKKFLDLDGLSHLWLLITNKLGSKVDKEFKTGSTSAYKVLSDNNLTDALMEKINNAGSNGFSGDYNDLTNKPDLTKKEDKTNKVSTISSTSTNDQYPTAKAVYTAVSGKANVSSLSTVATSGSYNDLSDKPTIPTNNNQLTNGAGYQTAEQVNTIIQNIVGSAPEALNTLKELADALGNDANFAATMTTELGKKLNIADLVAITNEEIDTICV